jgi:hypothetical protein
LDHQTLINIYKLVLIIHSLKGKSFPGIQTEKLEEVKIFCNCGCQFNGLTSAKWALIINYRSQTHNGWQSKRRSSSSPIQKSLVVPKVKVPGGHFLTVIKTLRKRHF